MPIYLDYNDIRIKGDVTESTSVQFDFMAEPDAPEPLISMLLPAVQSAREASRTGGADTFDFVDGAGDEPEPEAAESFSLNFEEIKVDYSTASASAADDGTLDAAMVVMEEADAGF